MMAEEKMGFFKRLVAGLNKTRDNIVSGMDSIFHGFSKIDEDFYEELEEVLIMGDLGVKATYAILDDLRKKVKEQHIKEPIECRQLLIDSIKEQMDVGETAYEFENQTSVVLVIGVNGVGKTTTIGKLAGKMRGQGKKVVLAAADTFRAAAGDQLKEWAHRSDADLIGGQEGADPAAIVYDAVAAAKARKADILLVDTAGRLHNKKNLMEELKKINRVLEREYPEAYRETLVVLDATTGQNALSQAKEFSDVADITGIILTKMDGTAKGGIAVAIQAELGIPVKYIGVGETIDDLQKFDSDEFVQALFTTEEKNSFIKEEPQSITFFRQIYGSEEFINGKERWCLWLYGHKIEDFDGMPCIKKRIDKIREIRLNSSRPQLAGIPHLFAQITQPLGMSFIIIPSVSSEFREYIPMGYLDESKLATNLCMVVGTEDISLFGILTSKMHMAWVKTVGGRLKTDYRYSAQLCYNTFPFPSINEEKKKQIEEAAENILVTRAFYPEKTLAELYDPDKMPEDLKGAHAVLDDMVDSCYPGYPFANDEARLEFLFKLYEKLTSNK